MDIYEELLETTDILADPDAITTLKNSAIDEKSGRLLDEVKIFRISYNQSNPISP